ncbi:serine hydrolase domain-containing protein [Rasiella sp. SM2506]|uniref:serine hydrolase domain-containing protein n=1 Tax=Rasiella sp. SM2506 TaxID=3423914 RepID=UPI003D796B3A
MKKVIIISIPIIVMLLVSYHLLKPIITHNFGKEKLEDFSHLQLNTNHSEQIKKQADSLLVSEFNKLKTPALSASIGINNTTIWSNIIGYADVDNQILADSLTTFRIGSTSKALTSVGLGVLIQSKKLTTQSLVKDFVPYASPILSELTVQQLASHTSGIRNYGICYCFPIWEYYNTREYESIEESISVFNEDELLFVPSTNFSYSSYNYTLLSAMMEEASEKNFLLFMQEKVFQPLAMNQTKADRQNQNKNTIAKFYEVENGEIKESYEVNNSVKWAGGGFVSTTNDLIKLGNAVLNYSIVDSLTSTKLFEPVKLNSGKINNENYGMGWRNDTYKTIRKDGRDVNVIHHGGVAMGSTAMLILLPEYNITVAVTMNRNASTPETKNLFFSLPHKLAGLFINSNE